MKTVNGSPSSEERSWENSLSVYSKRLELIASNIANADTPHYKARDLDFKAAMSHAMQAAPLPTGQAARTLASPDVLPVLYRVPAQGSADGNTVDMDVERAAFAETSLRYQLSVQQVAHEYKEMSELFKSVPY
ncbi:flagellar basal body rod protein FlgB [Massilia sp. CF038]|uniref:flagellar basal body rod protein FlgB n=1 Tax=Massilia sp. CF038 TaxID=1881045 RepID=UPI000918A67B|nr:flagellar basal body rod protein FlgB [Massilia sp. CF038]SHG76101.1 flagellar basal-body rod protein FlgB [Massilia sp. CF038]